MNCMHNVLSCIKYTEKFSIKLQPLKQYTITVKMWIKYNYIYLNPTKLGTERRKLYISSCTFIHLFLRQQNNDCLYNKSYRNATTSFESWLRMLNQFLLILLTDAICNRTQFILVIESDNHTFLIITINSQSIESTQLVAIYQIRPSIMTSFRLMLNFILSLIQKTKRRLSSALYSI